MSIFKVTDFIECAEVFISENPLFCTPKSGFVRLVKDEHKRAYVIQLYDFSHSSTKNENARPKYENEVFST